jgi:hypothetical protein
MFCVASFEIEPEESLLDTIKYTLKDGHDKMKETEGQPGSGAAMRKAMMDRIMRPEVLGLLIKALQPLIEPALEGIGLNWSDVSPVLEDIPGLFAAISDGEPFEFLERRIKPHVLGQIISSMAPALVRGDGMLKPEVLEAMREMVSIAAAGAMSGESNEAAMDEDDDEEDDDEDRVPKEDRWTRGKGWDRLAEVRAERQRMAEIQQVFEKFTWLGDENKTKEEIEYHEITSGAKYGYPNAQYNLGTKHAEGSGDFEQVAISYTPAHSRMCVLVALCSWRSHTQHFS